ncbi:uncharacterized protein [Dysidea avara]|uniref:uncharacterized protein n=1 Tax=Dysidea avara TaxID=196820 RepID=UPI00331F73C6
MCTKNIAAQRGFMATFDVACSRNGNASCINVNVDVPTVAAALMPTGGQCSDFISSGTCTELCRAQITPFVNDAGCCYHSYYSLAIATQASPTMRTSTQLLTACGIDNPGTCSVIPSPCENAQFSLAANPTCASAQASAEVAFDSGSPVAESDIITACTQTCRNLISDSVVMCTDNIAAQRGFMATFDVACSRNGNASCINVNVDVPTVAAALMPTGGQCSDFISSGTCTELCRAQITPFVNDAGCCYHSYYSLAMASQDSPTMRTSTQLLTACGIDNPGTCSVIPSPCENAQFSLAANPTCASAQASAEVAFDSGSPVAESDIITACTQTCRNLISDSVVMCTDNIAAQRGFEATFDVACRTNGDASCINVNVDVPTVAAALMPTGGQCSDFISSGTCTELCRAQITRFVNDAGCCYHPYYSLAIASQSSPTTRTSAQLLTACGIDDPGICSVIPSTRIPCENAQLALQANPTCASAQASSEVAFDSGSPIAESDIITVCTQTCRNLISDSVVMCTDNIAAQRGFEATFKVACRTNGDASCINVDVDVPTVAAALMPTGGQCSDFISSGTCTALCKAQIIRFVNDAGCCYHPYYSLAIASQPFPTTRTSTQLLTACEIDDPGICSAVRGGGGADTIKAISTLGLLMITLITFMA